MLKKTFILILILFAISFSANFVFALEVAYPEILGTEAPDSATSLPEFIKFIFNLSVALGGLLGFGALIFGGIKYISSAGNVGAISDAKLWIGSGITGLFLLLSTYLILTAINPNLIIFKEMESLQSDSGICLCSTNKCDLPCLGTGKKYYTINDIPNIDTTKFEAKSIKFISPQDELTSIFLFANPNFIADTTDKIIKINNNNNGETIASSVPVSDFTPASIYFLKNKPGIYLYKKIDFCEASGDYICLTPPKYIPGTIDNLTDFNNQAQSIKIIHQSDEIIKQTLLFKDTGYMQTCSPIMGNPPTNTINNITSINNLDDLAIGNNNLVSIQTFTTNFSKELSEATIYFYDSIDCDDDEANKFSISLENSPTDTLIMGNFEDYNFIDSDDNEINFDKKVLSFKIEMKDTDATYIPYTVILATTKLDENDENKKCESFKLEKPYITNCVSTLKATSIYDPDNETHRPRSFYILSTK
ncbi:MAG: hypothetical protein U9Q27_00445 [Patescibacteria group bacterium]|nr:hypothetical protein [Patescibacteria group bacterium]